MLANGKVEALMAVIEKIAGALKDYQDHFRLNNKALGLFGLARRIHNAETEEDLRAAVAELTAPVPRPTPPLPADGVEFELTLTVEEAAKEAIHWFGEHWEYRGARIKKAETKRVKLIRLGHVNDLDEAQEKAKAQDCRLVVGQWRAAFEKAFPRHDNSGPIAFGGESWLQNSDHPHVFPTLLEGLDNVWLHGEHPTLMMFGGCGDEWRWLAENE